MACLSRGVLLLLAVLLCCNATTLDIEEKQKEEKARQAVRNHVGEGTAEDKPDPPQNIRVSPQGYSGMLVLWDKSSSSDVDHYYVYVEGTGLEGKTPDGDVTFYIWEGLEPCTTYTFGVQTVSSSEVYSDRNEVDGETEPNLPPAPQSLHVEKTTANAVTLAWEKPDTLCDISQYKVVTHQENGALIKEDIVTETTAEVSELEPGTSYTFKVYASTSTGEGPATSITGTTELGPGKPQNLDANAINSSAIYVTWSAPQLPPSYYLITAYEAGIFEDYIPVDTHDRLIGNLNPCTTCYITVTSYYEDEEQKRYEESTTGETDPNIPDPPKDCSVEPYESYIAVTWDKPTSYCALGPYSVDYTVKKLWGNFEEESYNDTTPGNSYVVQDKPLPYHSYTFEIAASVNGMFGDSISCNGTSLETNPGKPKLVSVVSEEEGEVQVTWEPPADENGQIIGYGIFVNDAADSVQDVSGEVRTTTVPLQACVSVDISVAARNNVTNNNGWGDRSNATSVTPVGDKVPEKIDCPMFGDYLQACWLPYSTDCPVSDYNLKWDGEVLWSPGREDSGSDTLEWTKDEICYNISTVPYTEYTVSLNVGKNTEVPVTCSVTTPMAAPGPPTVEKLETEELTILVTWKEPQEKNGVISNYSVKWMDWNGEVNSHVTDGDTSSYQIMLNSCGGEVGVTVSAKTEEFDDFGETSPSSSAFIVSPISDLSCEAKAPGELELGWKLQNSNCPGHFYNITWSYASLWSNDNGSGLKSFDGSVLSATLENLKPYSNVSVVVHVENSPEVAICNAITLEEASSAPLNLLQIGNDSSSARVGWDYPEAVKGNLILWNLFWTTEDERKLGEANVSATTMSYKIEGLSSSGTYDVSVAAVNGAGIGTFATTKVKTLYVPKETPLGLILGVSIGGGVLLILLAIGGFVVYKKRHQTKTPRSAPFMPSVVDADDDKLYKKQHQSSANQRLQGKGETIDFGTNRELYPADNIATDPPRETDDHQNIVPEISGQILGMAGDRRMSQQVPSSQTQLAAFNRRPSQVVNMRMKTFEEYNRRSSQPVIAAPYEHNRRSSHHEPGSRPNLGDFGRRPSQQIDLGRPNLGEFGRRPSQQIDVGRYNFNEFGRRPSQQVEEHRPRPIDHGRRFSQQIEPRPRLGEYGRRPSQQTDLGKPHLREYGRRPSQQIDLARPNLRAYERRPSQQLEMGIIRHGEFARRPSQQIGVTAPHPPMPPTSGYEDYKRRPSQQTDIGLPSSRAYMRRPSQQFVTNFEGIKE